MPLKHRHQTALPNNASSDVSANAWNDGHAPDFTGIAKSNGTDLVAATSGTDYLAPANARPILSADITYNVSTTGNDSTGDGSAGNPWLTIQHAMNVIATIDFSGHNVSVQLADGTYGSFVVPVTVGQGAPFNLTVNGNSTTPTNVVVQNTNSFSPAITVNIGCQILLQNFRVTATNNGYGILNYGNTDLSTGMDYFTCGQFHIYSQAGLVTILGNYTISGNAAAHWTSAGAGNIVAGVTIDLQGLATAFSSGFAEVFSVGHMQVNGCTFLNAGAVTGQRYNADTNGVIQTFGAGATYLPGNAPGTAFNGAVYQ